ncbi:MAG: type II toxin-antitoxin system RelE/ParE family toxin [Desulfovibrio sp.]|nr:type II toxin-antitoxin system RelE/ParE family toxin [Desulfovibrio sp.]
MEDYLDSLRDRRAKLLIARRIQQAASGNLGDHHTLKGGLHEMRIDHGPGYRVYYGWHGKQLVLLLLAGDKSTQQADIVQAKAYLADFKERNA